LAVDLIENSAKAGGRYGSVTEGQGEPLGKLHDED
jgi:hypothetical protein